MEFLCRLRHKWRWWSADYGSYVQYRCLRCDAQARRGWSWGGKKKPLVMKPTFTCTHSVHGTALPACMRCANLRPYPW